MRHKHNFKRTSSRIRKNSKSTPRRGSSTSLDSHYGARLLNALTNPPDTSKSLAPNLKRRTGNAGLDSQHINNLLSNGKLVIPCNVRSVSDDESVSVKISESRYSVVLNNHDLDLNDQLLMKSLRHGLHIDSSSSTDSEVDENLKDCGQEKRKSSRNSRRSSSRRRRSRDKYGSNSESCGGSSSCPELKRLMQVE